MNSKNIIAAILFSFPILAHSIDENDADYCSQKSIKNENKEVLYTISEYEVIGNKRLYFHALPNEKCVMKGIFVIPGDKLKGSNKHEGWIFVNYVNPVSKKGYDGWVIFNRLKAVSTKKDFDAYNAFYDINPLILGVKNTAIWTSPDASKNETYSKKSSIDLHFNTKIKPLRFTVKPAARSGMSYIIEFKDNPNPYESYAITLPVDFACNAELNDILIDDYNEIAEGAYLQIAEYDFVGDSIPEVIIAAGDGLTYMCVNIFQYNPPELEMQNENWKLIGKFSGQDQIAIDDKTILIKRGSRGFEEEMICKKDRCFDISTHD